MDKSDLFSVSGSIAKFYNNKANYIEWDVGNWFKDLPEDEKPDLSENYREKHNIQTSGDAFRIIMSVFNTWRRAGRNVELNCINYDAEKLKIKRSLFDMSELEIKLLRIFEALQHISFFDKNIFEEIKMFVAFNDGSCSLSHNEELSKYGAYAKKELLVFLNLCSIDKQRMLTQAVSILNGIIQSNDVDNEIREFLEKELNEALDS